jgi:UDP-N-acetylglucosamine 2-epimerase (non-hydrolysing)
MKKAKVISVFGTRPEATKMAPLVKALAARDAEFISKVIVTAQHREMLDQVLRDFNIESDYDLNVMTEGQTLAGVTTLILQRMTPILEKERPDIVLVHGDTVTTGSTALAAYYQKITVGHVEAGLRTGDKYAPFPEEVMRRLADTISDLHFAPTHQAKENLSREGISGESVYVTGNTAIDALLMTVKDDYVFRDPRLASIDFDSRKNILVEVHRRENFGQGMEDVSSALAHIARNRDDVNLLVSVHKNPNAGKPIRRHLEGLPNVTLFDPVDYPDFVNLMKKAYLVISDSGGLQEETPSLGVPMVLCREKTERPEAISAGTVVLVGTNKLKIIDTVADLLDNVQRYKTMCRRNNPFGDGLASERIAGALLYRFGFSSTPPQDFKAS